MSYDDIKIAFATLPAAAFPFTLEAIDYQGNVVWTKRITGPTKLHVPPLISMFGPVAVRTTFPDGTVRIDPAPKTH
jgi:hypothetical protein